MHLEKESIPKIIHYCWFGKKEKPIEVKKNIENWKDKMPDYKIIEWNEKNFNINYNNYTKQAYKNKKFAFVSDVARLYALYNFGGIYFDTDIEVIKSLDEYLDDQMIISFESKDLLMTAFIAVTKKNKYIKEFLDIYNNKEFINKDKTLNLTPNTFYFTELMKSKGCIYDNKKQILLDNISIYPLEIFGAFDADESSFIITEETVLIHRCKASWMNKKDKIKLYIKKTLSKIIGYKKYKKLRSFLNKYRYGD